MSSFAFLRERLGAVGEVVEEGDEHLTVDLPFLLDGVRRAQRVDVAIARGRGQPWLVVTAPIAPLDRFDAARVLAHGATLLCGSLCAVGRTLVARFALPLHLFDPGTGMEQIALLCHEASRLAAGGAAVSSDTAIFDHYA